ncbi:DNA-binding protein [Actinacidiphila glaucinigra]|uniref:DNA-binding protein n=1 Tax=Actinacidiphila glaucinigra TaxID=235986 RepID=UPI00324678B4
MASPQRGFLTEELAAEYTGRPASTIRRWATEGRINRYGSGRGKVRYNVLELPVAIRDEWTREIISLGDPPPLPHARKAA